MLAPLFNIPLKELQSATHAQRELSAVTHQFKLNANLVRSVDPLTMLTNCLALLALCAPHLTLKTPSLARRGTTQLKIRPNARLVLLDTTALTLVYSLFPAQTVLSKMNSHKLNAKAAQEAISASLRTLTQLDASLVSFLEKILFFALIAQQALSALIKK